MKKTILYLFILIIFLVTGCSKNVYKNKIFGSGTIEATETNVSAKVIGRITHIEVEEGQKVGKGQLIAKLDDLDQAEKDFMRAKGLFSENIIPVEQLEKLQKIKDNFIIFSPIAGTVIIKELNEGEIVTPGVPIITLADINDLWVKIYISEKDIGKVKIGAKATVFVDSFPKEEFVGEVKYISERAEFIPKNIQTKEERVTQVFEVKVKVDNPGEKLKIGMPADVYIEK